MGNENVRLCADDTVILAESDNQIDVQEKLRKLLDIFTI